MPIFFLFALGCDEDGDADQTTPEIAIAAPAVGADVGSCFTLVPELRNFTLVNPGEAPATGRGHYHVTFGTRYVDCSETSCVVAITGLEAGDVAVSAVLVGNDHAELRDRAGDPIADSRTFRYTGEACPEE